MIRVTRALAAVGLLATIGVLVDAPPAGAAVTVVGSGTTVTVTATGNNQINIGCAGGLTHVNIAGVVTNATPATPCSTLTKFVVNGDAGNQSVYGTGLDTSSFAAHPFLQVNLGDGNDIVYDTLQADSLTLGNDNDSIYLQGDSLANSTNSLGNGTNDVVGAFGTNGPDTIDLTSGSPNVAVATTSAAGTHTNIVTGIDRILVYGGGGNDTIDATGVSAASAALSVTLDGGKGANTLLAGARPTGMVNNEGGSGSMTSGVAFDNFYSLNPLDVINLGPGATDVIYDQYGLHSGGRTILGTGTAFWSTQVPENDAVARIRPGAGPGTSRIVVSLNRSGIQELPAAISSFTVDMSQPGGRKKLALFDVVAGGSFQPSIYGDEQDDDVADITIAEGTWSTSGSAATSMTVSTDDPDIGDVQVGNIGPISIHGPWTNANQGFAHRLIRDLLFTFDTARRDTLSGQLTAGTKTRAQAANEIIYTDPYRMLDVHRIYRRYLKRDADPGGMSYWVNAMQDGRSLRKFRAQLFGGNEYFTKAGSTNPGFVLAAYTDVLGRAPDPSGQAYWTNKLETGTSRATVANTFLGSTEARRTIIKEQFLRFLDRYPTTAEVDSWMEPMRTAANGEQALIAFLVASGAYYTRT